MRESGDKSESQDPSQSQRDTEKDLGISNMVKDYLLRESVINKPRRRSRSTRYGNPNLGTYDWGI
jgi:hypothetical protein